MADGDFCAKIIFFIIALQVFELKQKIEAEKVTEYAAINHILIYEGNFHFIILFNNITSLSQLMTCIICNCFCNSTKLNV